MTKQQASKVKVSAATRRALAKIHAGQEVDTAKIVLMVRQTVLMDQIAASLRLIERRLPR